MHTKRFFWGITMAAILGTNPVASDSIPSDGLTEIRTRKTIQSQLVDSVDIIDKNMVPVGAKKPGYHIWQDTKNPYRGKASYRFYAQDDKQTRIEMTALFATAKDIAEMTEQQVKAHKAAKSLYHFGKGMIKAGETWTYEYGLYLPSSLNAHSQGIISQWHGIPDRTTVMLPNGTLKTYSLEAFNSEILSQMYFVGPIGHNVTTKQANGYKVDQGGYPPMSLKVGNGSLYLLVRADYARVTDKTDRVNLRPPKTGPKTSPKGSKHVSIPFMKRLDKLPRDTWIDMKWEIRWPSWPAGGHTKPPKGTIKLSMDGIEVLSWVGPLGNNDAHPPYFKYGIYKAGPNGMDVSLAGFKQYGPSKTNKRTRE